MITMFITHKHIIAARAVAAYTIATLLVGLVPTLPNIAQAASSGDVVVSEVMFNPDAVSDSDGEWIELHNTTGSAIDLTNWMLRVDTDGTASTTADQYDHTFSGGTIPSDGYFVICKNNNSAQNGGVSCDDSYSFDLDNTSSHISLYDDDSSDGTYLIESAAYNTTHGGGLDTPGQSIVYENGVPSTYDESTYGDGDYGTPGAPNSATPSAPVLNSPADGAIVGPNVTLDWSPGDDDTFPHDVTDSNYYYYYVEVATDSGFEASDLVGNYGSETDTEIDQTGLADGTYYWRVRAEYDPDGTGHSQISSDFSETRIFVVDSEPAVKDTETIEVTGDTAAGENQVGWLFNRDQSTKSEFEFNEDTSSIGDGALYVQPIDGSFNGDADKFIGEYFLLDDIANIDGISYDFKIGNGGDSSDANQFYMNVYANYGESTDDKYYDCKYDVVPTNGSTSGFTTVTFDPTQSYPVTTRTGGSASPYTCPSVPTDMDTQSPGSTIRMFAINVGDTSNTDAGLDGYYDKVVVDTDTKITTFDFEKGPVDPENKNQLNISGFKFHNRNQDRDQDEGEERLSGWTMRLYKETESGWIQVATSTTDENGVYKFPTQQEAGVYHTCEVAQLGWKQVYSNWSTFNVSTDNESPNADEEGPYCSTINYTDEHDKSNKKYFGNIYNDQDDQNQFTQSGIKFNNKNEDRDRDAGEETLAGWTFNFYKEVNNEWTLIASSTSNENGVYKFPQQKDAGVYHVCEVMQEGWRQVRQGWSGTPYHIVTENQSPNAAVEGPYCSTATYTDAADHSNKKFFGNVEENQTVASLTITDPATDGETLQGEHTFKAEYVDADETEDHISWAIRAGTCQQSTNTMAGNVDGHNDSGTLDGSDFSTTVDMSGWDDGEYCFVVNPQESSGADLRETRTFNLENPEPLVCTPNENLIANGSFEQPAIEQSWKLVQPVAWIVKTLGGEDALMEIQRMYSNWAADDGDQYAELDATSSTKITQSIPTIEGKTYTLSWAYAGRPGTDSGENQLEVTVDGDTIDGSTFYETGIGNDQPDWKTHEYTFTGTGEDVEIGFADQGESDGLGTFVDDVSLTCNPDTGEINYCGDGEMNQDWEQCEIGDEGCNQSCQFDNQCHYDQLVKITLDGQTGNSTSFDGKIYLGASDAFVPNGTWFNWNDVGDEMANKIADEVDGLAVERDHGDGTLKLAYRGGNRSGAIDYVQGDIEFRGFSDIGTGTNSADVTREINGTTYDLEDGNGNYRDLIDVTDPAHIDFDMRADTGNDGVTIALTESAVGYGEQCEVNDGNGSGDTGSDEQLYRVYGRVWNDAEQGDGGFNDSEDNYRSGALVSIGNDEGTYATTTTDEEGYYSFMVPAGEWTVDEDSDGWETTWTSDEEEDTDDNPNTYTIIVPLFSGDTSQGLIHKLFTYMIPVAHAQEAEVESYGPYSFGTTKIVITPSVGITSSGGSGGGVQNYPLNRDGSGGDTTSGGDNPTPQVLGAQTTRLPSGAPNAGAGGTATDRDVTGLLLVLLLAVGLLAHSSASRYAKQ